MKISKYLEKGDTVAIVAPAKYIEQKYIDFAKNYWQKEGFKVVLGAHVSNQANYFSGSIEERRKDFQDALNNDDVKAIICARGGYGCVDIVDVLQWGSMLSNPKWIIGFSDVTVFHQHLQRMDVATIHATMPLNYAENSEAALSTLKSVLKGDKMRFKWQTEVFKAGETSAELIGGNLSILYSLLGTDSQPDYRNKIMYIEEVGEHLYAIDRMFYAFAKSGVLDKIKGLLVGGITSIKDTEVPFGLSLEEIILKHFKYRNIPIAFNFPAGHIKDNQALVLGGEYAFAVTEKDCLLELL